MTRKRRSRREQRTSSKRRCTPVPGSARDSSIEKKLTVCTSSTSSQRREGCSHKTLLRKSLHRLYISISQLQCSPSRSEERR